MLRSIYIYEFLAPFLSQGSGGGGFALDYSKRTYIDKSIFYNYLDYYYIAPKDGLFQAHLGSYETFNEGHGESRSQEYPTSITVNDTIATTECGETGYAFVKKGDRIQAGGG